VRNPCNTYAGEEREREREREREKERDDFESSDGSVMS
jgi:hypothetical protein